MRKAVTLLLLVVLGGTAYAQHAIRMVHLWHKPQVHLVYRGYHLFFKVKDINTTIRYLHAIDPKLYPDTTSFLQEDRLYATELTEARDMEYMNQLQPILQQEAGAFMLLRGHAYIETDRRKKVKTITWSAGPAENHNGNTLALIHFYDAHTGKEVFAGMMNLGLQSRYLELQ